MLIKLKRDLLSVLLLFKFFRSLFENKYADCLNTVSKIDFLESNISSLVANLAMGFLRNKYAVSDCNKSDTFINSVYERFSAEGQKNFLMSNIIVIKPYISEKEKGVILLNYSEVINAFPFLFDLDKIQQRYHLVLEPSWASAYQMYYKFYSNKSMVFVQSLNEAEIAMDKKHGYFDVPLCAGDWVNENNFTRLEDEDKIYDFCVIANFIPFKRYPYLLSALKNHWTGNLKFAIIASAHVGENRAWIENQLRINNIEGKADLFMEIPQKQVGKILNQSKCHVLCSLREGANRANFESMLIGTPVVVHKHHMGFPNFRFGKPMVVNYTNQEELVAAIKETAKIDSRVVYEFARKTTGSYVATNKLNECIKDASVANGDIWTKDLLRKINIIQSGYFDPNDVHFCEKDYLFIEDVVIDKKYYDPKYVMNRFGN